MNNKKALRLGDSITIRKHHASIKRWSSPYSIEASGPMVSIVNAKQLGMANYSQNVAIADKDDGVRPPIVPRKASWWHANCTRAD